MAGPAPPPASVSVLSVLSVLRSTAASSLTASRRWAWEDREQSSSKCLTRESPPPLFCMTVQVQSRVSRTSVSFLLVSTSSCVFFFSWELSSVTAS